MKHEDMAMHRPSQCAYEHETLQGAAMCLTDLRSLKRRSVSYRYRPLDGDSK